ncbi:MAG: cell wall-binding repeat-containing protein [Clostridia bacterium]|nr:cell wall-binding repeat-containing protein [Clostridia bacterium]
MRSLGKKITCLILALAMVLALTPVMAGPVYAQDTMDLPAGEVMASTLEPGHLYRVADEGTTIVLAAGDDVTVDAIAQKGENSVLTIKGSSAGKLTVTDGIDMQYPNNSLVIDGGTLYVDRTTSGNWKGAIEVSHYTQHGGNVTAKVTNEDGITEGLMANYGFLMDGGLLNVSAVSDNSLAFALYCEGYGEPEGSFALNGGTITASATGTDGYVIRVQHMNVISGELKGTATGTNGTGYGLYSARGIGSTFEMKDGTIDLTVNSTGRAEGVNIEGISIQGGTLTGKATSSEGMAYGIDNYFDNSAFTMSGGTLHMTTTAPNSEWNESYPYYLNGVNITGGTIKAKSNGGKWGYGMWIRDDGDGAVISNAILDLTVEDVEAANGLSSSGDLNISASTLDVDISSTVSSAYGLRSDGKMTLTETEANIKVNAALDPNGIYVDKGLEMTDSIATIEAKTEGRSGCGVYVRNELNMQDSEFSIDVTSGGQGAYGIWTGDGAYDWNINYSEIEANVNTTSNGSYANCGIAIHHDEGESTVNLKNSKIIANCKAPDAFAEGFTSISDLTLSGKSSIEATGEAEANAHGIYVRGDLTMNGSNASLYGHGISSYPWNAYGIRADGTITLNGRYYVSIPEDGIISNGYVEFPDTHDVAAEAKIEAYPVEHLRIFGKSRYETAMKAADYMKESNGWGKFTDVIVASGQDFADALSGSYLAAVACAPILLVHPSYEDMVYDYIQANTSPGGTVYLLGGKGAVSEDFESRLTGFNAVRLGGKNRYETNVRILNEANKVDDTYAKDLLVCSGTGFADALSTSSVGKPILLVGNTISDDQKQYLTDEGPTKAWIIGGEGAVSADIADELKEFVPESSTTRLAGKNRYETSFKVADEFYKGSYETAVIVYGQNFPDGLSGGAVAWVISAPVLLAMNNDAMNAYVAPWAVGSGAYNSITFGGAGLVSDESILSIMNAPYEMVTVYGE